MDTLKQEIAQRAAALIVDEGLEYGVAKRKAARELAPQARGALPGNDEIEQAVREHIALYCADSQPAELAALRALALDWMERLAPHRPHLAGAVWHGTATRRSDIYIQLFCDDAKSAEIELIDQRIGYRAQAVQGFQGEPVDALTLQLRSEALGAAVALHLLVHDHDDLRGALRPDAQGRSPRGDLAALRRVMAASGACA